MPCEQNAIDSMQLTSHANESLEQILGHVESVREQALDGAEATEEQSVVVKEIQQHLGDITVVSEQTSSASEMVAATSEQLSPLATDLQRQVSRFKL
jgi:methyl-accepting chemotaxis protein